MATEPIRTHHGAAALLVMLLGTPAALRLSYEPELFAMLPWIRMTVVLLIVTWTSGVAGALLPREPQGVLNNTLMYAVLVPPLVLVMMHPGPEGLHMVSDEFALTALLLTMLVHGVGFSLVNEATRQTYRRAVLEELRHMVTRELAESAAAEEASSERGSRPKRR